MTDIQLLAFVVLPVVVMGLARLFSRPIPPQRH